MFAGIIHTYTYIIIINGQVDKNTAQLKVSGITLNRILHDLSPHHSKLTNE